MAEQPAIFWDDTGRLALRAALMPLSLPAAGAQAAWLYDTLYLWQPDGRCIRTQDGRCYTRFMLPARGISGLYAYRGALLALCGESNHVLALSPQGEPLVSSPIGEAPRCLVNLGGRPLVFGGFRAGWACILAPSLGPLILQGLDMVPYLACLTPCGLAISGIQDGQSAIGLYLRSRHQLLHAIGHMQVSRWPTALFPDKKGVSCLADKACFTLSLPCLHVIGMRRPPCGRLYWDARRQQGFYHHHCPAGWYAVRPLEQPPVLPQEQPIADIAWC
nr:hypothetical protein [bacterium]